MEVLGKYNKQECIDSFMSRKVMNETEDALRNRIIAKNGEVTRLGQELARARKAVDQMQAEFNAARGENDGLINFAFSCEIERQEADNAKTNGVDESANGKAGEAHGA